MKRYALLVCLLALSSLAMGQDSVPAPDTQIGNYIFHMPTGWHPENKGDATYIPSPATGSGGVVTLIVLQAGNLDGDLQKSFNDFWGGFHSVYQLLSGGQIVSNHSSQGYDAFQTTAIVADKNGIQWHLFAMGAQYKQRIQCVVFLSNEQGQNYAIVEKIFQTFLASLSFGEALPGTKLPPAGSDAAVDDKAPSAPPGKLAGIYVCTAGGDAKPANKQYIFYPDGFMMYGIPEEGMIGFDFDHYRSESNPNKNWVGRYKVEGDKIKIVWQNEFGDPANPVVIKRNETSAHPAWEAGWDTFIPMCRCTGKKFAGKYVWGAPAGDQYIQFFPDGTFIDHRLTDQMIVPSSFYEHPRIQRGTYSIESQTIIFNFSDGHRATRTFLAPKVQEKDPMFDWIDLGWKMLFEDNYRAKLASEFEK